MLDDETFEVTEEQLDEIMKELTKGTTAREKAKSNDKVFYDVSGSPLKATLLYYLNSGCAHFNEWKYFSAKHNNTHVDIEGVKEEIMREEMSEKELEQMISEYQTRHPYAPKLLLSCAACGYRKYEEEYQRVLISDKSVRKFKYDPIDELLFKEKRNSPEAMVTIFTDAETKKRVNAWDIKSFYVAHDGHYYHLHPELVGPEDDDEEVLHLCCDCYRDTKDKTTKKIILPPNSIAAGTDFGWYKRIGLVAPNLHEQNILSFTRLYLCVYKMKSNKIGRVNHNVMNPINGHSVLFAHNAPTVAARSLGDKIDILDPESLYRDYVMQFLDEKGKFDFLYNKVSGSTSVFARWWELVSLMRVFHVTSSEVFENVNIPSEAEAERILGGSKETILKESVYLEGAAVNQMDSAIGSDVAGVAQDIRRAAEGVRDNADEQQMGGTDERRENDEEEEGEGEEGYENRHIPLSTYYVLNDPSVYENKDRSKMRKNYLNSIGKLVDLDSSSESDEESSEENAGDTNAAHNTETASEIHSDDWINAITNTYMGCDGCMRSGEAINEFSTPDVLIRSFPTTFMLGKSYPERYTGKLGSKQMNHLLHQFTCVPSTDFRLLGYLQDFGTRCAVLKGVNAHVKSSSLNAKNYLSKLLHDKDRQESLRKAIEEPTSPHAEAILREYVPHLQFSGRNVSMSYFEPFRLKSELCESTYRRSAASAFATLAFNDIDNPRGFRASFSTTDRLKFPAMFEEGCAFGSSPMEFMELLTKGSTEVSERMIQGHPLHRSSRASMAISNPVAYVEECKQVVADVCGILFGIPLEHFFSRGIPTLRKTKCYTCYKGILGHPFAVMGVMEAHAKGTLHFHLIFFGGISPFAMQQFANIPQLCEAIVHILDKQYKGTLPATTLLTKMVKQEVMFKVPKGIPEHPATLPTILQHSDLTEVTRVAQMNGQ